MNGREDGVRFGDHGAGKDYVEIVGGVRLEMVWIPGGSFRMGSPADEEGRQDDEGPVHAVELEGFWLGKYQVTQEQYESVMGGNPSHYKGARNAVDHVTWDEVMAFCPELSRLSNKEYALPTEGRWEYASRAGSTGAWCFGDDESILVEYAWYCENSGGKPRPVGGKRANAWGLHDMHGNIWEWCADWYDADYYGWSPRRNPTGPKTGTSRVLRGGLWYSEAKETRSAKRCALDPAGPNTDAGFRVCGVPVIGQRGLVT